jgi:hypothetical protein
MKRTFTIFILSVLPVLLTFGQSLNLLNSGYTWSNFWQTSQAEDCCKLSDFIKFSGDTVVQTVDYKKVLESDDSTKSKWRTIAFVREDIKKGLYYRDFDGNEILLYHYNLKLNDTVKIPSVFADEDSVTFVVMNIENVLIDGSIKKKYLLVYPQYHNFTETWIEGIGSLQGILTVAYHGIGGHENLICCFRDDVLIYKNMDFDRCYYHQTTDVQGEFNNSVEFKITPNPSNQEISIQFADEKQRKICIYNSKGSLIEGFVSDKIDNKLNISNFQAGIYFVVVPNSHNAVSQKFIKY